MRTDADAAVDALRDLAFAAASFRVAVAQHYGVGVRETEAVAYLVNNEEVSAGQLAQLLRLTPGSVTSLVDRLERAGLASRETHPTDLRRVTIRPTQQAHQLVGEVRAWLWTCLADLPDLPTAINTFDTAAAGMRAVRDNLHG